VPEASPKSARPLPAFLGGLVIQTEATTQAPASEMLPVSIP
jgi:hypothetical protein